MNSKQPFSFNIIALSIGSRRLISWWDMIQFQAERILPIWQGLERLKVDAERVHAQHNFDGLTPDGIKRELQRTLIQLKKLCQELGLGSVEHRQVEISMLLLDSLGISLSAFRGQIDGLQAVFGDEFRKLLFTFVPLSRAVFFEQDHLFGEAVATAFPDAETDIKSGANCLAADLPTAAVYHFMCAAEHAMRAMAARFRISKINKVPVELATWETLIQSLEAKANSRFARTTKGQGESDFYKTAFTELRAFKEIWRNKVMHARIHYTWADATHVFYAVGRFMNRVAVKPGMQPPAMKAVSIQTLGHGASPW